MAHETFFKHQLSSRADDKADRVAKAEANQRTVYKAVELRDEMKCRATGVRLVKTPSMQPNQLHHHHVTYRSKGGMDTTQNVCLVSREAHDAIHMGKMHIEAQTADGADGCLDVYALDKDLRWVCVRSERVIGIPATRTP